MLRNYTKEEVLAAWRRRQGLISGWLPEQTDILPEIEANALEDINARYARLLRQAPAELLPTEDFTGAELEWESRLHGSIRVRMPDRAVRPLEIEYDGGGTTDIFHSPGGIVNPDFMRELTGGVRNPVAVINGEIIRILTCGEERPVRLTAVAYPADGSFRISPELFPYLFENYEKRQ